MSDKLTIRTNNVPRDVLYWCDLTEKERAEFDYLDTEEKQMERSFVRYKNWVYDLNDVERVERQAAHTQALDELCKWHGYVSDSFFSGVVFRYVADFERVICGTYFA